MISFLRWLLLPISFIYQFVVWSRNKLYDLNLLKSQSFKIPTIVVGNLAIGGAGKSPMTEYLIRLLKNNYKIATLSRGYGRKTKGYKLVNLDSLAIEVGDEPLQFKKKFPNLTVSVCEDRCQGIKNLESKNDVIILDDAFQHRKLKAGLNILLFDFNSLFSTHLTLPTGNFRDVFSSTKRADVIVITKCPKEILNKQKNEIERFIRRYTSSPIFYSSIHYNDVIALNIASNVILSLCNYDIVAFCGIANPLPLVQHLTSLKNTVHLIQFPDHHNYSDEDFKKIKDKFDSLSSENKIIITTEKDIQRIRNNVFSNYPLYYIPIHIKPINDNSISFDFIVESYINRHFVNKP